MNTRIYEVADIDVIIIARTWLQQEEEKYYQIEGYHGHFCLRETKKKGCGVAIYVNNKLNSTIIQMSTTGEVSIITVQITNPTFTLNLVAYYKPPTVSVEIFLKETDQVIPLQSTKSSQNRRNAK